MQNFNVISASSGPPDRYSGTDQPSFLSNLQLKRMKNLNQTFTMSNLMLFLTTLFLGKEQGDTTKKMEFRRYVNSTLLPHTKSLSRLSLTVMINLLFCGFMMAQTNVWNNGNSSGFWSDKDNWSLGEVPTAADDVEIYVGLGTCIVDINAECKSLTFSTSLLPTLGGKIEISSTNSLTVYGAVTINHATGGSNIREIAVGSGTLTCSSLIMTDSGNNNRKCIISATSGIINVTGNISMAGGAVRNIIDLKNSGTLNLGGSITGGSIDPGNSSTVNFNGTAAQTLKTAYDYHNVTINNAAGVTPDGNIDHTVNVGGNLSVVSGILNNGGFDIHLSNAHGFSVSNGATFNLSGTSVMVTGTTTKTFGATSTVNYTGSNQTVSTATYGNLGLSGSDIKAFAGVTTIAGNISISSGTKARLNGFTSTANALNMGGLGRPLGSHGSSISGAAYQSDVFFDVATSGIVNIATNTCAASSAVLQGDNTICFGGSSNLQVNITGGVSPYTVVYSAGTESSYVSGSNISVMPGSTTTYSLTSVTDAIGCTASVSGTPTVTVRDLPAIGAPQPMSQTVTYGDNTSFIVVATGTGPLTYQWQEFNGTWGNISDGGVYSGTSTATLMLTKPTVAMSGRAYRCVVDNICNVPATSDGLATLTVNQRPITITADIKNKVYGSLDPALTAMVTSGSIVSPDVPSGALSRVAGENVGPYAINQNTYTYGANYFETYVSADLTITQLSVTVTADAKSKTYGNLDPALTYVSSPAVGSTLANGDVVSFSGALSRVAGETVAGSPYAINQGTVANANYAITYIGANLTINTLAVNVTADAKSKTYGSIDPALTFVSSPAVGNILANGDVISFTGALSRAAGETVAGSPYPINQGTLDNANYAITYTGANLTINTLPVTVTADAKSKTYGSVDPALTFVSSPAVGSILANGDVISFTGALSRAAGETVAGSPYAINQGSLANANYSISYIGANLTINTLPVTVTADAKSKTYGSVDPALTFVSSPAVGSILANGDVISFTGALSRAAGETVAGSPYAINQGTLANANYAISYTGANLTINLLAVTVTADAKSKTYGDVDPALTYVSSPGVGSTLANGDVVSFTGSLTRDPGETVAGSPYAINQGTVANANYAISYTGANLTINLLAVTVTADAKSKTYGDVDPALTFVSSPLVGSMLPNGDVVSFSGALTRVAGETVAGSPYAINQGTVDNVNYAISYTGANLTINPYPLTITANNQVKCEGVAFTFAGTEFTTTPLLFADNVTSVTLNSAGAPMIATAAGSPYPIVASAAVGSGLSNYAITYVDGTFTVNPIPPAPTVGVVSNCDGTTATLTAMGYTGTLLWSTGATTSSITVNTAGPFTVTQTELGCTSPAGSSGTVTFLSHSGPIWYVDATLGNNNNIGSASCPVATIGKAVMLASNGHTIHVQSGTYNEQVLVNKEVTLVGVGPTKPIVNFTGTPALVSSKLTIFEVTSPNVTIDNFQFSVDVTKLGSAILASSATLNNLTVTNNNINPYRSAGGTVSFGLRNAISVNVTPRVNSNNPTIDVQNNTITYNTGVDLIPGNADDAGFRSGVATDEGGGIISSNTITTISHDVLISFGGNPVGATISNNNFNGGGLQVSDLNAAYGPVLVSGNTFTGVGAPSTAVLRLKNNYSGINHTISGNTFNSYEWAVSLENMNNISFDNNTFNTTSPTGRAVVVNTKSISTNSSSITQVPVGGIFTNNDFNGTGTALTFLNHDSDNDSYGSFTLGTPGNENNFSAAGSSFIVLDNQTGPSNGSIFPNYDLVIGVGANAITTKACWDQNLNAQNNKFDVGAGLQLPTAMTFAGRTTLESKLTHKADNACLGLITYFLPVHNLTQNTYYSTIQAAVNAANNINGPGGDVIECAEWTFNERVTINKSLTLQGVDKANCILTGSGLAGVGSGITINNGITNVTIQNLTVQNFTGTNGNSHAGIYGIGGNNNTTVTNVALLNNPTASGFYANGPVNNVSITNSMVTNNGGNARGIVIWNGLKTNITITGNMVTNNTCCGIELQDGDASAVNISNNTIDIGSGDNALGLTGLNPSVGANLINMNTITGGGRFGIEIKNPAGGVTVSNNNVSLTTVNSDRRDRAGIAVFRRGVLNNNVDVPNGVTVTGNTVTGYVQNPLYDEGFGIVIEGTNHTVTGNTISNCNVGIQQQGGAHPNANYPAGDGDQGTSNQSGTSSLNYFGRGNSPMTCGNTINSNTFMTNTLDTRNIGVGGGIVTNTNTSEIFCSIQSAINDLQTLATHTLEVSLGTYNEQVLVNKGVTIKGAGVTQPVVDFTGTPTGKLTLFDVSVDGVTIENIHFNVNLATLKSAIIASGAGIDYIAVKDNLIDAYGTPLAGLYSDRNAVSVNHVGNTNYRVAAGGVNSVIFTGNTVNGTLPLSFFRAGIALDEGGLTATGNTLTTANHDVLLRFASNGANLISGNTFNGGGVELSDQNAGSGLITVSNNIFTGAGAPGTAVLRVKNNNFGVSHSILSNTFTGFDWAVSLENMNLVTLDGNTFTGNAATDRHIVVNTKSISSNSNTIVQIPVAATMTNNAFNGMGIGLTFQNHDSDNDSYGTFTIGTAGNANTFASTLTTIVELDAQTGTSNGSTFPIYPATPAGWPTTMDCWATNLDIQNNTFDVGAGQQSAQAMSAAQRTILESKLTHKPDVACLGNLQYFLPVKNVTQNTFYSTIQAGINAAAANDVIELSEWTFNEAVTIDKSLTLQGVDPDKSKQVINGTGLGVKSGITINSGVTGVTIQNLTVQNFTGVNGNSHAGIYGIGGNNNTTVTNVALLNNPTASGFYANGPVNNVSITNSMVTNNGGSARGIVIWNGLKTNITITGNMVTNNTCCGIELQDGDASAVNISNNTIDVGNGDNALGLTGLNPSVGANLINMNTITGGGRFGIEIKNPAGGVTVSNNNVSLTTVNSDRRDRAGIAVFRRGVLNNNVDVPNGVTVTGNTVTGYVQNPLYDEGFGIVIEGTNHTVTGNTISNCNVGIQQQGGAHPNANYPAGDGDQGTSGQASTASLNYFGRGNSPFACGNVIEPNTFGTFGLNGIDTRNVISANNLGLVTNTSNGETFCNIQAAIDDAQTLNGHTLTVAAGTYGETINLNKSLTLRGPNYVLAPCVDTRVPEAIITGGLNVPNGSSLTVVVEGFHFQGVTTPFNYNGGVGTATLTATFNNNLVNSSSGQMAVFVGNPTNNAILNLNNNCFQNMTGNAMQIGGGDFVATITNNIINTTGTAGINADAINNSTISNNTITNTGQQGIQLAGISSNVNITNNVITNCNTSAGADRGGIRLRGTNYSGPVTVSNNIISGSLNGVAVANGENITGKTINVNDNNLSGNVASVYHGGTGSLNAECNWHGSANFNAIQTQLAGSGASNIDFVSYLTSNGDGPGFGFQPTSACNGTPVVITNVTTTPVLCGPTAGDISVTFSGGTGPYTVSWAGPASGGPVAAVSPQTITPLVAGNYTVTVTDGNGSTTTATTTIQYLPVTNITDAPNTYYATIQAAIDAADPGDIIDVCAGTYAESLVIGVDNLTLRGPNTGIDPNGLVPRVSEAIINPTTWYGIYIEANNVEIDGFTVDGLNASDFGIYAATTTGLGDLLVTNNIIKKLNDYGFIGYVPSGPSSSNNFITRNKFDQISGRSVVALWNYYTNVTDNVITNTAIGLYTENANMPESSGLVEWKNNNISASRAGIWYNLAYATATPLTIKNNTINVENNPVGTRWDGIWLTSLGGSINPVIKDNIIIGGIVTQQTNGYNLWNNHTTATDGITIEGGSVSNVGYGVWINNWDGFPTVGGSNASSTRALIDNISISNASTAGIFIKDNPLNTSGINGRVFAEIKNSTISVSSYATGISVSGVQAGADVHNNNISGGLAGISANGTNTTAPNELTVQLNTITNAAQVVMVPPVPTPTPTVGISLTNITGGPAAMVESNTIIGPFYGYGIFNLNTTPVTSINGGTITGVMQGVAGSNLFPPSTFAASNFNVDGITMSGFTGNHPSVTGANFHAGVYTFTGGASAANTITSTISNVNVSGTGKIAQDCAGLSFADFSTPGIGTMQNITVNTSTISNNLNRGVNARGDNAVVTVNNSTLSGNGSDAFGTGGNVGFGAWAYSDATLNLNNNFITNPSSVAGIYGAWAIGAGLTAGTIINATNNRFDNNGLVNGGLILNSGTINAECNWWGSPSECVFTPKFQNSGTLDYNPWLVSDSDTDADMATGYQPGGACLNNIIVVSGTATPALCFGTATGSVDITVTGGSGSYTYIWSNGAVSQDISGLIAGTYTVTVTESNGCTVTGTFTYTVTEPALVVASGTQVNVLCNGFATGSIDVTVVGGSGSYSYLWNNGATTQDRSGLIAGTYTVTITESNGCTVTPSPVMTFTITQPTAVTASISGTTTVVQNAPTTPVVTFNATGGVGPYVYTYTVSYNGGAATPYTTPPVGNIYTVPQSNAVIGTYVYTLTSVTDANLCSGMVDPMTVTIYVTNGTSPDFAPAVVRPLNGAFIPLQMKEGYVQFTNGGSASSAGIHRFRVSKSSNFTLSWPAQATVAGAAVQNLNTDWTISDAGFYWEITSVPTMVIAPNTNVKFGFILTAGSGAGTGNMTVTVINGTGGDSNDLNNKAIRTFIIN